MPRHPDSLPYRPDSLASLWPFKGVAEFQFDEVISEGGSPNRGQGTGGLEKLVILSPTTAVPEVRWKRNRITVRRGRDGSATGSTELSYSRASPICGTTRAARARS